MEVASSSTPVQARTHITDEQRAILIQYHADGLTGIAKEKHALIQRAVEATGLPEKVVRGWVGNFNRSMKPQQAPACPTPRGANGYQLFCSQTPSPPGDGTTRLKEYSKLWNNLSEEERNNFNRAAQEKKKRNFSEMTEEERETAVKKHTRTIRSAFVKLGEMRTSGLCVVYKQNETFTCSSGEGAKVLDKTIDTIDSHFVVASAETAKASKQRDQLRKMYREKLSDLYSAYIGIPNSKFPYEGFNKRQVDFLIEGLPSEITYLYSASRTKMPQLKAVLSSELTMLRKEPEIPCSASAEAVSTPTVEPPTEEPDIRQSTSRGPELSTSAVAAAPIEESFDDNGSVDQSSDQPSTGVPCQVDDEGILRFVDDEGNIVGTVLQPTENPDDLVCEYQPDGLLAAEPLMNVKEDFLANTTVQKKKKMGRKQSKPGRASKDITSFFKRM